MPPPCCQILGAHPAPKRTLHVGVPGCQRPVALVNVWPQPDVWLSLQHMSDQLKHAAMGASLRYISILFAIDTRVQRHRDTGRALTFYLLAAVTPNICNMSTCDWRGAPEWMHPGAVHAAAVQPPNRQLARYLAKWYG